MKKDDQTEEAESAKETSEDATPPKRTHGQHIHWWQRMSRGSKIGLAAGIILVLVGITVAATALRYPVVGLFHKGQIDVTVTDDSTHQPLLGAQVEVAGRDVLTDKQGHATLTGLPLGKATVSIVKHAYQTKTYQTTVFWHAAKLGTVGLHSTGVLIKFMVKDWVSEQPLTGAEVTLVGSTGSTNSAGEATVSVEPGKLAGAKATIKASGFNDGSFAISKSVSETNSAALVPSGKVFFFSNRSGKIDLYSSNLDGSSQTVVLAGTGNEDQETGLLPSVEDPDCVAIVSSRAGTRINGQLQHDLYMFEGGTNAVKLIDERVAFTNFRGWIGGTLVYVKANDPNGNANTIKAFDMKTKTSRAITTVTGSNPYGGSAYLGGLAIANQNFYYNVSSADPNQNGFWVTGLSGSPKRIDPGNASYGYRQTKDSMAVQLAPPGVYTTATWKKFTFSNQTFTDLPGEPASQTNRGYADSADGKHSVYVETRDGKSELYLTDAGGMNDQAITNFAKVNQFVQWYNDRYVVFSSSNGESSLYVIAINGGSQKKVADFYQGNGRSYGGGYNPSY